MSNRESNDNTSQSGKAYASGQQSTANQKNVLLSKNVEASNNMSAKVFNGHAVEVYADNGVFDTVSGTFLFPGRDFNTADLHRK